ncbi:MAG: type VI secretion system baseplate subunit TssG [Proteobacteria bacterium]|nr:type VI secretion system baseplate subunit TssG [Pseudomonadota bacterium]
MTEIASRSAELRRVLDAVEAEPHAQDFFALLRRIEILVPDMPRWGEALRPSQEPIRLGQEPELDFAPAGVAVLERSAFGAPRLGVRFFGLLGPHGPMPLHLTEFARERIRHRGDPTLARFLDMFHHRMLALFYRAWAQCQPVVQHDRPAQDRYAAWLGASYGASRRHGASERSADRARLYRAGLLALRSRHPEGLAKLLQGHFDVPVQVVTNVPQRLAIAPHERSRLGVAARLGSNANAGRYADDRQFKFRIVLGPLNLARYLAFLPGGTAWQELVAWVQQAIGLDLRWDVRLRLARAEVPKAQLMRGKQARVHALGVSVWLGHARSRSHRTDRGDLLLASPGAPHG